MKTPKFKFGDTSQVKLLNLDYGLQSIMNAALHTDIMDFSIVEGHRGKEQQNKYCREGKSRVQWPNGKHNKMPSHAVDAAPYINGKISWNKLHCCVLAGIILACAARLGIPIRWGGNWDRDGEPITDQEFQDLVHYEIVK